MKSMHGLPQSYNKLVSLTCMFIHVQYVDSAILSSTFTRSHLGSDKSNEAMGVCWQYAFHLNVLIHSSMFLSSPSDDVFRMPTSSNVFGERFVRVLLSHWNVISGQKGDPR